MLASLPDLGGVAAESSDHTRFMALYGHLFEHSPWVIERTWAERPFADAEALHAAMMRTLADASLDERLALLRAHPELADKVAIAEGLTESSQHEQASAGLDRLSEAEYATFHALNTAYRARFGFPFIICVKLHDKAGILRAMRERLEGEPDVELDEALRQVGLIGRVRLAETRA
ncbi:MAG TPA: 2-oxo-4-hydroxy-4-carboxy-5-ureidoimidazoline decarboxylase [Caulobacteraceae bacterium]|nr:2-oxo-4-hydroxy-4-carboxy-5-ureidoimidazoline decarboxylase [Caulobacteraceae bacterium]